jgi:hypothetical protein
VCQYSDVIYRDFYTSLSHVKSGQEVCLNCKSVWISYIPIRMRNSVKTPYSLWIRLFFQFHKLIIFYFNISILRIHIPK